MPVVPLSWLLVLTYAALALPVAVFMVTWTTPAVGLTALAALGWGLRGVVRTGPLPDASVRGGTFAVALAVATFWLAVSGAGGVGWQQFDWLKHNSVLLGLTGNPWPVFYSPQQPLVYYVAYYILPALAGRGGGWATANAVLAIQSWSCFVLAALWVMRQLRGHAVAGLLCFTLFSGLDVLGNWLVLGQLGYQPWWARLQYPNPASLLTFVPQHLIVGWLATAAVLECDRLARPQVAVLIWCLSPCWSPFVTLGLAPFVGWSWLRHRGYRHQPLTQAVVAAAVLAPAVLFFQARGLRSDAYRWSEMGMPVGTFALFMLLEWVLYALLLVAGDGRRLCARPLTIVAMVCLALVPFLRVPDYTDFVMRVSIPALFVLALQLIDTALRRLRPFTPGVAVLWLALAIGALQPLALYGQALVHFSIALPVAADIPALPELGRVTGGRGDGLQYIGRADAPFFRYVAARGPG